MTARGIAIVFLLSFAILIPKIIYAQIQSSGMAISIPIVDKNAKDGSIISSFPDGFRLSKIAYDPSIYGVISENPALSLQDSALENSKLVISQGKGLVQVSTANGAIKINDLITSSDAPGIGQKAKINGFVLGTALENYSQANPKKIGKILVSIDPHYNASQTTQGNLLQLLKNGLSGSNLTPLASLRYFIAVLILIITFVLGFMYFGRLARTGVEALGRNPLAGRVILAGIVINVIIALSIIIVGILIAYLVLTL